MATDDNVVRLKHIKTLAQAVADEIADITLSGGSSSGGTSSASAPNDADFALYVPNNTSIIVTGKQPPVLSIGSWSFAGDIYDDGDSTKIYTAPVTYSGDGTLSTDNGTISNGVLTVHDSDGIFEGIISASAGNDFAASTLHFNHDSEPVTVDNDTDINNAIQAVGAKFIPAVSNADDFSTYDDFNIQFFDNRLKKIIDGGRDFEAKQSLTFLNFTTSISTLASGSKIYIQSSKDGASVSTGVSVNNATTSTDLTFYKLNEKTCVVLYEIKKQNGDYEYSDKSYCNGFSFDTEDNITTIPNSSFPSNTVAAANSSIASCEGYQDITALNAPKSNSIIFLGKTIDKNKNYGTISKNSVTKIEAVYTSVTYGATVVSPKAMAECNILPTIYGSTYTGVHANYCDFADAYSPVIEFNGEQVNISKSTTPKKVPLLCFDSVKSDSTGNDTVGGAYVYLGVEDNARLAKCQLTTIQSGVTTTLNPWGEDDGSVILGLYPTKRSNNQYVVTYNEGSYTKANWLNKAFDVWIVEDTATPKFTKTTKTITDIVDDVLF